MNRPALVKPLIILTVRLGSTALAWAATPSLTGRVIRVIDGDPIAGELDGRRERVRDLGVNTPETKPPTNGIAPDGTEASEANRRFVEGKTARVAWDVQQRDKYGRLLASVEVGEVMINAELVRQGSAQVATFPPTVRDQERFLKLRGEAREAKRGLWGAQA
jgi:micrococcal nuclease